MTTPERPQIYLVTPPDFELGSFPDALARVLDAHAVACVRLSLATRDEDRLARAADALRETCHARDIALVVTDHMMLAERHGLDGVHLSDAARSVRAARKLLGPDGIVGAFCGASRHDGMTAGEAGADYVSFGPVTASSLDDGRHAPLDLFEWWSEVIEVPVVSEGGLDTVRVKELAPFADFLAFGEEIWSAENPAARLGELIAAID